MQTLEEVKSWLDEEYNKYISVYVYQDEGFVRLTDGSGGHYVDIYPNGSDFILEGERPDGETIATSCDATRDALVACLASTF